MSIPLEAKKHLRRDPFLKDLIARFDEEIENDKPRTRIFDQLLNAIIGQQLSGKAANAIRKKFIHHFEGHSPTPQQLINTNDKELRPLGLSSQKAGYLKNVARFWIENKLDAACWNDMHEEAIIDLLTQIKGVGRWTVEMILIFDLNRNDVFPIDDLGVRNGMALVYNKRKTAKGFKKWAITQSAKWSPYRTWGSRLMWKAYDHSKIQASD